MRDARVLMWIRETSHFFEEIVDVKVLYVVIDFFNADLEREEVP